ncbi:MAG TPA: glycosyltransferase family 39 protein, partial [Dehalococcoidia bacterium]|nr:glycosyltransferase family 39 protein [Dehalococcoidia bacterium]
PGLSRLCYTGEEMRKSLLYEGAVLAAALAIYLALALYQIDLPGLYYDEAADAVLAAEMVQGEPVELFRGAGLWLGDRAFPLMVMDYVGAVNSYLLVPFFSTLGVGVASLRLMTVLGSAVALVLTYFLARGLFGWVAAALAVLLLAVHPSFIFWSRQGIYVTSIMAPLALGGILCLRRWHTTGRYRHFILGLLLLGLGISAKLLFLWVLPAAALLYLTLSRKRFSLPQGLGGLAALVLGAGMPILYNLQGQGTFTLLSQNLQRTEQGVDNLALVPNLITRAGDLAVLLDGGFFWFLGGVFRTATYPYVFLGAAAALIILAARPRIAPYRKGIALILGFIVLVFLQSGVTVSGLWPTHFFILLPFAAMVVGLLAWLLPRTVPWPGPAWVAGMALWAAVFLPSLGADLQYHQALSETGGWMAHSDGVYRLAGVLERRGGPQPLAMDWGVKASVQVLTQGRVNPQEVFQYQPEPDQTFYDLTYKGMQDPGRLYIFRAPELTVYPRFEHFESLATRLGKKATLEETVAQRDGRPLYLVYAAR